MSPEQIASFFVGAASLVTAIGGVVIAIVARRGTASESDRLELAARRQQDDPIAAWRVRTRAYIARLREKLADLGVETDEPPPFPDRPDAAAPESPKEVTG
ncbi:MAG TPA: hypothetical protein VF069_18765 [Streptosporangiaceae bacterium]